MDFRQAEALRVRDYPNVMSKFLNFGMNIKSVVAASTLIPSRVFPFLRDKGTLNIGAPADIAVLDLQEGNFQFVDNYENVRYGAYRFFPFETILSGRKVARA